MIKKQIKCPYCNEAITFHLETADVDVFTTTTHVGECSACGEEFYCEITVEFECCLAPKKIDQTWVENEDLK